MYYIIVSNVGLIIMMIYVYGRYSTFRISSTREISKLRKNCEEYLEGKQIAEDKLLSESKLESGKIEKLLREIDDLRKDKEAYMTSRFEVEKKLEVALQKAVELQNRLNDRKMIYDVMAGDSDENIVKIGSDLYKKLSESHKAEIEANRELLERVLANSKEFFEKNTLNNYVAVEDPAKKLAPGLVEVMKMNGHVVNKDYFLASSFSEQQKAKSFLCEIAFIKAQKLYIIDFKACYYFAQYDALKVKDKVTAAEHLKQHLDKYLNYLNDEKYSGSILRALSSSTIPSQDVIMILLPNKADLQVLKEIQYDEKVAKAQFEVIDFESAKAFFQTSLPPFEL
jgi:hypothetical protein